MLVPSPTPRIKRRVDTASIVLLAALTLTIAMPVPAQLGRNWKQIAGMPPSYIDHFVDFAGRTWCIQGHSNSPYPPSWSLLSSANQINWQDVSSEVGFGFYNPSLGVTPSQLIVYEISGPVLAVYDGIHWSEYSGHQSPQSIQAITAEPFQGFTWCLSSEYGLRSPQYLWRIGADNKWERMDSPPPWGGTYGTLLSTSKYLVAMSGYDGGKKFDVWRSEDGVNWNVATDHTPWPEGASIQIRPLLGSVWVDAYAETEGRSLWRSSDGENWASKSFPSGIGSSSVRFITIGGKLSYVSWPNVYWTSIDCESWMNLRDGPFVNGRAAQSNVVFNDAMWVMGGKDSTDKNDVWKTTDGISWEIVAAAAVWPARHAATVAVFKDYLWVIGGAQGEETTDAATLFNDVWRTPDGIHWENITTNAPWLPRYGAAAVVLNEKLWLVGGDRRTAAPTGTIDVWNSADGVTWQQVSDGIDWGFTSDFACAEFNNQIWVAGHVDCGDGWAFLLKRSADGLAWTDQNLIRQCDQNDNGLGYYTFKAPSLLKLQDKLVFVYASKGVACPRGCYVYPTQSIGVTSDGENWKWRNGAPGSGQDYPATFAYQDRLWYLGGTNSLGQVWTSNNDPAPTSADYDTNNDATISLSELTRLIQFYNFGSFHCAPGSEDGYAPGAGDQSCPGYSGDYQDWDWRISLSELLRAIQLFNSHTYHPCFDSEDGFCPGTG